LRNVSVPAVQDPSPCPKEKEAPSSLFGKIEDAFLCILSIHVWGRDAGALRESTDALARGLAALPPEELRPLLRRSSREVDAALLFTGLWGTPSFRDVLARGAERRRGGLPEAEPDASVPGRTYEERLSTPFVAFLLAGTDFPFTEEELSGIRSGDGVRAADIRAARGHRTRGGIAEEVRGVRAGEERAE